MSGLRGRPAKPTAQHKADGTFQPSRHANRLDAKPIASITKIPNPPPRDLSERAAEIWRVVEPMAREMGTLTPDNLTALANYCDWVEIFEKAKREVDVEGITIRVTTSQGDNVKTNPAIATMKAASQEINSIGGRFGFTPSDRAKVKIDQQPAEKSALAKLMSAN